MLHLNHPLLHFQIIVLFSFPSQLSFAPPQKIRVHVHLPANIRRVCPCFQQLPQLLHFRFPQKGRPPAAAGSPTSARAVHAFRIGAVVQALVDLALPVIGAYLDPVFPVCAVPWQHSPHDHSYGLHRAYLLSVHISRTVMCFMSCISFTFMR